MNDGIIAQKRDSSLASAVLLVSLIAGLIAVPVGFGTYHFMKTVAEENGLPYDEVKTKKILQNPVITKPEPGKEFLVGSHTRCKVTV